MWRRETLLNKYYLYVMKDKRIHCIKHLTKIDTMYQKAQCATIGDHPYLQQCIK